MLYAEYQPDNHADDGSSINEPNDVTVELPHKNSFICVTPMYKNYGTVDVSGLKLDTWFDSKSFNVLSVTGNTIDRVVIDFAVMRAVNASRVLGSQAVICMLFAGHGKAGVAGDIHGKMCMSDGVESITHNSIMEMLSNYKFQGTFIVIVGSCYAGTVVNAHNDVTRGASVVPNDPPYNYIAMVACDKGSKTNASYVTTMLHAFMHAVDKEVSYVDMNDILCEFWKSKSLKGPIPSFTDNTRKMALTGVLLKPAKRMVRSKPYLLRCLIC